MGVRSFFYSSKKIERSCKPGYVATPGGVTVGHLSTTCVATSLHSKPLPISTLAAYPPTMGEQPLNAGILDLATHKTCGIPYCCGTRWALTPPFHPYRQRLTAVVFCHATLPSLISLRYRLWCSALPGLSSYRIFIGKRPTAPLYVSAKLLHFS